MSNFICHQCGTACYDTPWGYVAGCEHYPPDLTLSPDRKPLRIAPDCVHESFYPTADGLIACSKCGARFRYVNEEKEENT